MKSNKHLEFEAIVTPLIMWLRENHHPHMTVVVTSRNAEVLEGQCSVIVPFEDDL